MRVCEPSRNSVYPAISRNDNHWRGCHHVWNGQGSRPSFSVVMPAAGSARSPAFAATTAGNCRGLPRPMPGALGPWHKFWRRGRSGRLSQIGKCRCRAPSAPAGERECSFRKRISFQKREPRLGNEGVGEHVRTRFHLGERPPVKLRTTAIRTERRKPVSPAGPVSKCQLFIRERTLRKVDPAV